MIIALCDCYNTYNSFFNLSTFCSWCLVYYYNLSLLGDCPWVAMGATKKIYMLFDIVQESHHAKNKIWWLMPILRVHVHVLLDVSIVHCFIKKEFISPKKVIFNSKLNLVVSDWDPTKIWAILWFSRTWCKFLMLPMHFY